MTDDWRTIGLSDWLDRLEVGAIKVALTESRNVKEAAELLKIGRTTLTEKMQRHGIRRTGYFDEKNHFQKWDGSTIIGVAEGAYSEASPSFFCE